MVRYSGKYPWFDSEEARWQEAIRVWRESEARTLSEQIKTQQRKDSSKKKLPRVAEKTRKFEFDVALSFAGEQRAYVEQVATFLNQANLSVFYDRDYEDYLWGKDLSTELQEIYEKRSLFVIIFASDDYVRKGWPKHERKSALAGALKRDREYILLARFDETPIPGVPDTIAYVALEDKSPEQFAQRVLAKLASFNELGSIS